MYFIASSFADGRLRDEREAPKSTLALQDLVDRAQEGRAECRRERRAEMRAVLADERSADHREAGAGIAHEARHVDDAHAPRAQVVRRGGLGIGGQVVAAP